MNAAVVMPFVDKPKWLDKTFNFLAVHHYKVPVPYVLKSGSTVELSSNYSCIICVLNNDRSTEQILENVIGDVTIEIAVDSVVFVNCIFADNSDAAFKVAYSIDGEYEALTHLICGQNNDSVDELSSYVFVEGAKIQLLIPQIDLKYLNGLIEQDAGLSSLDNFYNDVIGLYNDISGIVFDRKYFAKADITGPGGAFYGRYFMGQSSESMRSIYLTFSPLNWGALHEMAHSFDVHFVRGTSQVDLVEVWTNIFSDYYQFVRLTPEQYKTAGWMMGSNAQTMLRELVDLVHSNIAIEKWNLWQRLIYLTAFFYKVGHKKLLTALFDTMISQINNNVFHETRFAVIDLIISQCNAFNIDVVYVNQLLGVKNLDKLLLQTVKYNSENTVNVYGFLLKPGTNSFALTDFDYGLRGDVDLTFSETIPRDLIGAHYSLFNNKNVIHHSTFPSSTTRQRLYSLPVGCYKFFYETGNSTRRYQCNTDYIVYDGLSLKPSVDFLIMQQSLLLNEHFEFLGLSYRKGATLDVDYINNKYIFDIINVRPHTSFNNVIYYSVEISNGPVWEVLGDNNIFGPKVLEAPLHVGQTLTIYHREPFRIVSSFEIGDNERINKFNVTEHGIVRDNDNDAAKRLITKIINLCDYLSTERPFLTNSAFIQNTIYLAYQTLTQESQNDIYKTVAPFLPDTNVTSFTALGSNNANILRAREREGLLQIVTYDSNTPNQLYSTYLLLRLLRDDKEIFSLVVNGTMPLWSSQHTIQLQENDIIYMQMQEIRNKRFIVIDGSLQTLETLAIQYQWKNNTFQKLNNNENSIPQYNFIVIFIIAGALLLLLILYLIFRTVIREKRSTTDITVLKNNMKLKQNRSNANK